MRAVLQLCTRASVSIDGKLHESIGRGMLLLIGVGANDTEESAAVLADKIAKLRIFPDENDRLNKNLCDSEIEGDLLIISNFTLYADCKKSRRPDFFGSAKGEEAKRLFDTFLASLRAKLDDHCRTNALRFPTIKTGVFGADMQVELINDGPVTLILDTDAL
ncbi:MAG: D-tyrosyl-tRNA(Tyr) deacylase [Clostridia bacterium]|nr:D-tyrosyl-tRNA(Tyr) deacylase [Clostridia bacterium]